MLDKEKGHTMAIEAQNWNIEISKLKEKYESLGIQQRQMLGEDLIIRQFSCSCFAKMSKVKEVKKEDEDFIKIEKDESFSDDSTSNSLRTDKYSRQGRRSGNRSLS